MRLCLATMDEFQVVTCLEQILHQVNDLQGYVHPMIMERMTIRLEDEPAAME